MSLPASPARASLITGSSPYPTSIQYFRSSGATRSSTPRSSFLLPTPRCLNNSLAYCWTFSPSSECTVTMATCARVFRSSSAQRSSSRVFVAGSITLARSMT